MNPSAVSETVRAVPRFERVKVTPAYKAVSGAVEQRIVRGDLKPGTLMPTEHNLALQFGVNRSTVREAIRQLEQEGLIARDGSKRLYVSMPWTGSRPITRPGGHNRLAPISTSNSMQWWPGSPATAC
ncbi:MAG: hypothetical protein JWQ13_675 [Ramlibacter sp.]|jgi:DNA-binding GntR family transcriptional regulator|nr:hypothetical protein [Ramlibacter sp.]